MYGLFRIYLDKALIFMFKFDKNKEGRYNKS